MKRVGSQERPSGASELQQRAIPSHDFDESCHHVQKGLGTFGTFHERLDLSLRSPRSLILHRVVVGASVPTPFSPSCRCRCLTGAHCPSRPASLATPKATSPILSLWETTYFEVGEALVVRRGHGNSRPCLPKGWSRVPLSLTDARGALSPPKLIAPYTLLSLIVIEM
ncbi:hypothetical protein CRG98_020152 [Punica granatum]|uniref:Uncharacterized protein n=1 Tax=Punica granatum TaxID=22663 RepID=A0A2I0JT71_PUNGR|nr:hypothetical protein CRG98_020152 [Punica granatum]